MPREGEIELDTLLALPSAHTSKPRAMRKCTITSPGRVKPCMQYSYTVIGDSSSPRGMCHTSHSHRAVRFERYMYSYGVRQTPDTSADSQYSYSYSRTVGRKQHSIHPSRDES